MQGSEVNTDKSFDVFRKTIAEMAGLNSNLAQSIQYLDQLSSYSKNVSSNMALINDKIHGVSQMSNDIATLNTNMNQIKSLFGEFQKLLTKDKSESSIIGEFNKTTNHVVGSANELNGIMNQIREKIDGFNSGYEKMNHDFNSVKEKVQQSLSILSSNINDYTKILNQGNTINQKTGELNNILRKQLSMTPTVENMNSVEQRLAKTTDLTRTLQNNCDNIRGIITGFHEEVKKLADQMNTFCNMPLKLKNEVSEQLQNAKNTMHSFTDTSVIIKDAAEKMNSLSKDLTDNNKKNRQKRYGSLFAVVILLIIASNAFTLYNQKYGNDPNSIDNSLRSVNESVKTLETNLTELNKKDTGALYASYTALNDSVKSVNDNITEIKSTISSLNRTVSAIQSDIYNLRMSDSRSKR